MNTEPIKTVLLIEDNPGDARLILEMFSEFGANNIRLAQAACMIDAETYLANNAVDIILLDLGLPDVRGLEAVRRARNCAPHVAMVVLSGMADESLAVRTLKEGAQDYLIKGVTQPRELMRALRYAIERKTIEEALFAEKERAQVTLDSIGDAVICTGIFGEITFLNSVAETMTGWSLQEAAGMQVADVFRIAAAASETQSDPVRSAVGQSRSVHLALNSMLIRRNGTETAIEGSSCPIHDRELRTAGTVIVFRDVSAARLMTQQMTHAAEHDFLTGLPNRLLLNDRIGQAIALAKRNERRIAILFLDLDGFKHINDSLGHPVGDKVLQSIAKRLINCVRAPDTVSRQGGDEFILLLTEVDRPDGVVNAVGRVLHALLDSHSIDQRDLHVTTSIGISIYPDDGLDAETLIKNADTAMYHAKEDGCQSYQFFEPAMNIRAVGRQAIEEGLRHALERQEFSLHYQPKVDLRTGVITGAEALLRWTHPIRGSVSPVEFIPVAEDCGLILPIGEWVLREACTQVRVWGDAGLPEIRMAVNVSALQFRNRTFLDDLFAILSYTSIDPDCLEVELTESVLMKRPEFMASILRALRNKGIRIAVDDFGTGYSSLSYLRKFPLDSLKIDQAFIREITDIPNDTPIVSAIISMAQSLKLRVVAEGVETQQELAFLQAHRCDEAQGYYFSRPVPPQQFATLLATQRGYAHWRKPFHNPATMSETGQINTKGG
jgi:diguanylate cyclase (GGDEF)-like protein/PAS domain S-box-containing protein